MGGSASKRRSSRSERCCSSRHGYSQECFDYVFNHISPRCSYLNEPTADERSGSSSSVNPHPLPSAPLLPYAYDDEEENFSRASSSTSSMNSSPSYACDDVDEEERQIDMAIWESLKATHSHMASISSSSQRNESPNHFSRELGAGCGICFEVISMPAICDPCGHVSCYECLLRIQGSTNRCPRCRGVITKVMRIYM